MCHAAQETFTVRCDYARKLDLITNMVYLLELYLSCQTKLLHDSVLSQNSKWADTRENQQNDLCAQQRLRSAWASPIRVFAVRMKKSWVLWAHSEDWSDWAHAQADLSLGAQVILLVLSCTGSSVSLIYSQLTAKSLNKRQTKNKTNLQKTCNIQRIMFFWNLYIFLKTDTSKQHHVT